MEVAPNVASPEVSNPDGRLRWSVDRYLAMLAASILHPEDRTELIDGEVIQKISQNPLHIVGLMLLSDALRAIFGEGFRVDTQIPVRASDSVPEPDIIVLRGSARDYVGRLPEASDVRLVAEVSDTSIAYDRAEKTRIYAHAQVEEYWILNVAERQLEIHRNPIPSGVYAEVRILVEGEAVTIGGRELRVADLLP